MVEGPTVGPSCHCCGSRQVLSGRCCHHLAPWAPHFHRSSGCPTGCRPCGWEGHMCFRLDGVAVCQCSRRAEPPRPCWFPCSWDRPFSIHVDSRWMQLGNPCATLKAQASVAERRCEGRLSGCADLCRQQWLAGTPYAQGLTTNQPLAISCSPTNQATHATTTSLPHGQVPCGPGTPFMTTHRRPLKVATSRHQHTGFASARIQAGHVHKTPSLSMSA